MSETSRIAKNTMYLYIKTGVSVLMILYTTRLVLGSLGETDFGIFNIVGGVISMLGFLNTAMAVTIQRFMNYEQGKGNSDNLKNIFNVGVLFHIIIAIFLAGIMLLVQYPLFHGILNIPFERMSAAKVVYWSMIASTVITILTVPYDASLNAHENMLYYSIVGIFEALLKLIVALLVIRNSGDKLILYGILMAIIPVISMVLMRVYCRIYYEECRVSLRKYYDRQTAKNLFSFAGWSLLGTSSNYFGNYGNMIAMNHYFGAVLNTVMGIANQIQGQLMVLSNGMLKAINPVIVKEEGAGNSMRMMKLSVRSCVFSFFLLSFFAIPMFLETEYVLYVWLGQYPFWTVLFVRLQLIRGLLEQLTTSLNKALEAKGRIMTLNMMTFGFNLLPIPILCFLYARGVPPYYHYIITISMMVIIPSVFKIWLCIKYCGLRIRSYFGDVILTASCASLLVVILYYCILNRIFETSFLRLLLTFGMSSVIQCAFVFRLLPESTRTAIFHKFKRPVHDKFQNIS